MISILCPTRGRPDNVFRLLNSIAATSRGDVETIFYLDNDDPDLGRTGELIKAADGIAVIGPRVTLSGCWNRCWEESTGDIAMQCGDDLVFHTHGWDAMVAAAFTAFDDRIMLVHGDDGFQHAALATHGFLHRRWVQTVGYFVPPYFASDYSDTWLTEVADRLGRRLYLPGMSIEHMHPVAGKGVWDRTHQERLVRHSAEGVDQIWLATTHLREADAEKLRVILGTPA